MTESRKASETRRHAGVYLLRKGLGAPFVRRTLGVSRATAAKWARGVRKGEALDARASTGRRPHVDREKLAQILEPYAKSGISAAAAVALIAAQLGVTYNPDHLTRVLRQLNIPRSRQHGRRMVAGA